MNIVQPVEKIMTSEITTINLGGLLGLGANCYLIRTESGFILIDTGYSPKRAVLEKGLVSAGCVPGNLKLIILTHGHGDHTGNCAYLHRTYAAPIAMHRGDAKIIEQEETSQPLFDRIIIAAMASIFGLGKGESFTPDIFLEDGDTLSEYGLDAHVFSLPGHSDGSIGILSVSGDLFCGDVFVNFRKPGKHFIVTDAAAFDASVGKLKRLGIKRIYPGHGKIFPMADLIEIR
jgi:hydroxyacylglutathione hydrolase